MSATDFERPPEYHIEVEPAGRRVRVVFAGVTVADSGNALVLHETRLPSVFYLPRDDVRMDLMERTDYRTHCPFKGDAAYWTLRVGDAVAENVLWSYEDPLPEVHPIRDYVAFYRNRMDAWYEEDEEVEIDPVTDSHLHGNPLVDWLMRDAWEAASTAELVSRLARQLRAVDIAVDRVALIVRTLHPQVLGVVHLWHAETDEVVISELSHSVGSEESFLTSPFVPIFEGRGGVRRRLEGDAVNLDYPVLADLKQLGFSDYAAMPLTFSDGQIHALTLSTRRPGGFATENLGHVHEILPLVSRLVEVHTLRRTARTLLDTYLGSNTGSRVWDGLIKRGDGEVIPAIIWWADLRDSTRLADTLGREEYLALLNRFFDCTAGIASDHGGEVLKFIGDAVLAIFQMIGDDAAPGRALEAARAAADAIARTDPPIGAAVALHVGDVTYGNIGIDGRLDFTVTGPAVNEVARLEGLAKQLDQTVIASARFAALVKDELHSLGMHDLRGVATPIEVFALR